MPIWALMCAAFLAADSAAAAPAEPADEGAKPWTWLTPGPVPKRCSRTFEVAGFADNERAMALTQHVRCPLAGGLVDRFQILDLIELKENTVLARYRGSPITRTQGKKMPVFVPPAALAAAYPIWARAQPPRAWAKIRRAGHFKLRKHDFKDVMVRVRLDDDSAMDVRAEGTKLQLVAPIGQPIGCMVVGRLTDGSEIDLGHVRDTSPAKQPERGTVEVLFSSHGHVVALVHHGLTQDRLSITHTRRSDPVASTQVGFLQMLKWDAESVKEIYGDLHPGTKAVWDEMVGDIE